mgnify:CR=1 FL=1
MSIIRSTSNPLFKRIRKFEQRKFRKKEGVGYVDGIRSVLTAAEYAPRLIEKVIVSPELLTGNLALGRLYDLIPRDQIIEFSADLLRALSPRDNPAGMGAIVQSPVVPIEKFAPPTPSSRYLVLDRIGDPGNLGTMIRTVDGAGFNGIILTGHGVDVLHQTTLKASLGTAFVVPIAQASVDQISQWASIQAVQLIGTSANTQFDYAQLHPSGPLALLLGNEREGLSADLSQLVSQMIKIPMRGQASSLNVAVAAGILMYSLQVQP